MITPRLSHEMRRSLLVPIIIDVENDVEGLKAVLGKVTASYASYRPFVKMLQGFGAPELFGAYFNRGYIHDIQLPSARLLTTFSSKENIEILDDMDNVRSIHYDMIKSAPPILPNVLFELLPPVFSKVTGRSLPFGSTEGWFGTKDIHNLLGVDVAHQEGYTADNMRIAVIDTGVHRQHRQLMRTNTKATTVLPVARLLERAVGDGSGHGTWCVSTINGDYQEVTEGIAVEGLTNAQVISIRALFTPLGMGRDSDILEAMSMALEQGVDIISMSLGGECEGDGCLLCAMVRKLSEENVIMCVAAGNEGLPDSVGCPGREPMAVTVGSVSITDRDLRSYFSSMGESVDCALYGGGRADADAKPEEYIYSAVSPYSPLDTLVDHRRSGYGLLCGTSMSTPEMAALVALWNDYYYKATGYSLSPVDVHKILQENGEPHSSEVGHGVPRWDWIKNYV